MFDTTSANARGLMKTGLVVPPHDNQQYSNKKVGFLTWEEHCVECGQPECFKTCKFFERGFDGKCKRFDFGIVYRQGLHICSFRSWGKLEAVFTGRMITARWNKIVCAVDRTLCCVARTINRLMSFIPGRIGAITIYRRIKLWMDRFLPGNKSAVLAGVDARVWASRDVKLHFSVIDGNREIFSTVIELKSGWSDKLVHTPPMKRGTRLLLFSVEDEPFVLAFERLDGILDSCCATDVNIGSNSAVCPEKKHAKFVKCVAWDLDNTMWKGILVEDGEENLVLNEDAVQVIKELDRRGIVNTIISKNDYDMAWPVITKFGIAEYFIFPYINWLPKSGNLSAVAKEININPDTFAFIDDSSFERGEVGEKLPQVRVFKETDILSLLDRPEFNPPISAESAGRRESYRKEMERVAASKTFDGDYKEFLKSCRIKLSFFDLVKAKEVEYERCYELIQRSNQLTLTGNRYSQDAFKILVSSDGMMAWGIRCEDKFGDYGIIGCVVVNNEGEGIWRVKEFVMSCRVARKGCEVKAIEWVKNETAKLGCNSLFADIVDTGRNGALKEAFKEIDW